MSELYVRLKNTTILTLISAIIRKYLISTRRRYVTVILLVSLTGLLFSLICLESAFQRSGAILVAFALISMGISNRVALELQLSEALNQSRLKMSETEASKLLARHGINDPSNFVKESLDDKRTRPAQLMKEHVIIGDAEVAFAITGTLICGFGDLPF